MSTTAGAFNETTLQKIRVAADALMLDGRIKQQFIPNIQVFDALSSIQTAKMTQISSSRKDNTVQVMWENFCGLEVDDNESCVMGGAKGSTNVKDYNISRVKAVGFTTSEKDFLTNEYSPEVQIAKQLLMADKLQVESLARQFIAILNLNKGVNALGNVPGKTVVGTDTFVAPYAWDATLAAYFSRVAVMNKFTAPVFVSGANLYESQWMAKFNAGNADGKGVAGMYNELKMYWDLFNVDQVNTPDLITYMIEQGSVALVSRNLFSDTLETYQTYKRWTMASKFLPGLKYDVMMKDSCDGEYDQIKSDYKVKLTADFIVNPTGCDEANTGILTFICGEPSQT